MLIGWKFEGTIEKLFLSSLNQSEVKVKVKVKVKVFNLSMGFEPVLTDIDTDFDGDGQRQCVQHFGSYDFPHVFEFGVVNVEDEFVVHLEYHFGFEVQLFETFPDVDHCYFDHIGGSALDGHIDGVAYGELAEASSAAVDVVEVSASAEQSLGVAVLSSKGDVVIDELFYIRILLEIFFDKSCCFFAGDVQLLGKSEGADAIDYSEIDRLSVAALLGSDFIELEVVDFGCRCAMDVEVIAECFGHMLILGKSGDDAQFDLGIVGSKDAVVVVASNEGAPYFATPLGADGDVLQIGV